jgi:hypothetical protein
LLPLFLDISDSFPWSRQRRRITPYTWTRRFNESSGTRVAVWQGRVPHNVQARNETADAPL